MDSNKLSPATPLSPSALDGLKVLELGQLIAGPFAAKIASLAKRFIKLHN
jgi:crotonobetainyl-CoA:carnitine CoA-transferase CaiB-like acyl-CoA transferase